jgi:Rieske Fe-S protein
MSWDTEEKEIGWTRREWVRTGIAAASIGAVAGLGGLVAGQILPPPYPFEGEIRETIQYTKFPTRQWWNARAGTPVRVSDFQEWQGATGVWRGLFQSGSYVPGTGFPCLIIRIKRDDQFFRYPPPEELPDPLPEGFELFYDDPANDVRVVVLFDRCVHLCCYPGWHVVDNPPPAHDYGGINGPMPPTFVQFEQEPIYCVCHGSQYDPMLLVVNVNDRNGARYVGAERVHGPAARALPVIPVGVQGRDLVGGMPNPSWYVYC